MCETSPLDDSSPRCLPQCAAPPHTSVSVFESPTSVVYANASCYFHHDFDWLSLGLFDRRDSVPVRCDRGRCPMAWVLEEGGGRLPPCAFAAHFCGREELESAANGRVTVWPGRKGHAGGKDSIEVEDS